MSRPEHHRTAVPSLRAVRGGGLLLLALFAAVLVAGVPVASAAVTHEYLPEVSKRITEGVPASSGAASPGPVSRVKAIAGDAGHVWLAENVLYEPFGERLDEFDAASGAYAGEQLLEEGGVGAIADQGFAVGHPAGGEEVYVGAGKDGEYVVAAYGGVSGKLQATWSGANTANESFSQHEGPTHKVETVGAMSGVAVDSSKGEAAGDVYVATRGEHLPELTEKEVQAFSVVDVLKPGPAGAEGALVGEIRGTCAKPGVCSGAEVIPFTQPTGVAVSGFNGDVFVTDGNQESCEAGTGMCVVDVFAPSGTPGLYSFLFTVREGSSGPFQALGPVAVDGVDGNFYVVEKASNVVDEFDAAGKLVGKLESTPTGHAGAPRRFENVLSVGVDPVTRNVFVGDFSPGKHQGKVDAFGGDLVIPDVTVTEPPAELTPRSALLRGTVNPLGAGAATCAFEYGTSTAYGQSAPCAEPVAEGKAAVPVTAAVAGLAPDTTYFYRLAATNGHGTNTGECPVDCGQFRTPGAGVSGEAVSELAATSATFLGSVDPDGKPTSYFFQYSTGSTEGCASEPAACLQTPAAPGAPLGSQPGVQALSRHVQLLTASTLYHYRLVAVSGGEEFAGPDQTFVTQGSLSGFQLLDGRQWELVSPPEKHGGLLAPIEGTGVLQAAASGGAVAYWSSRPTDLVAPGYVEGEQLLSTRGGAGGWTTQTISAPHSESAGVSTGAPDEYPFFSEDLSTAVLEPDGPFTSLGACSTPPDSERTPYLRHNDESCPVGGAAFQPIATEAPGVEDVLPGVRFGGKATEPIGEVHFDGASPDGAHIVLDSQVMLAEPPKPGEKTLRGLYEFSAGAAPTAALKLVSVLPEDKLAPGISQLGSPKGFESIVARGAVSNDGSRVFWSESGVGGHLYMRDTVAGRTLLIDAPQGPCVVAKECGEGAVTPEYQGASMDGARVFFTDQQRLTVDAGELPGRPDLYVCEVTETAGNLECDLTDLTRVEPHSEEAASVQGAVLGYSANGTTVYFVTSEQLGGAAALGNYLYRENFVAGAWEPPHLIANLSSHDFPDWKGTPATGLTALTARVSADGQHVVFMSDRSLTGYDNLDATTGQPDEEVFLYSAATEHVACVSCDPTGARPEGVPFSRLRVGLAGLGAPGLFEEGQGVAASVPGWTPFGLKRSLHQSRYLTDEGRVFFNSSDGLVPQDANHNQDVYEYEPTGVGSCTTASSTYHAASEGCVNLVSSGIAAGESGFVDASENGADVFFLTGERLTGSDHDTALDLYDAHMCTTESPCPVESEPPPQCATADACRAPNTEQPSIFGPPASATFSGLGNLAPAPPVSTTPKPKTAAQVRAENLTRALRACRRERSRSRRAACERRARRRYGPLRRAAR